MESTRSTITPVILSLALTPVVGCGSQPNDICQRSVLHIGVSTTSDFVRPESLSLTVDDTEHIYGPDDPNTIGDEDFWSEIEEDAVVRSYRWPVPDEELAFEVVALPESSVLVAGAISLSDVAWAPAVDSSGQPVCVDESGEEEQAGSFTILLGAD